MVNYSAAENVHSVDYYFIIRVGAVYHNNIMVVDNNARLGVGKRLFKFE